MTFLKAVKSLIYQKEKLALFKAIKDGNIEVVKKSINQKLDLELLNAQSENAFMYSVFHDQVNIAKILIQAGANCHIIEPGNHQNSYFCCKSEAMLNVLLEAKVDFNLKNRNDMSAFYYLLNNYKFDLAIKLLENGANPNDVPNSILKVSPFKEKDIFDKMVAYGFDYKRVYSLGGIVDLTPIQDSLERFNLKEKLEKEINANPNKKRVKI